MSQQHQKQKNKKIEVLEEIRELLKDILKEQKSLDDEEQSKDRLINCGLEYDCKNLDCRTCQRVQRYTLDITHAEESVIEDFAFCDLKSLMKEKPGELELMQKIMQQLFQKLCDIEYRGLR